MSRWRFSRKARSDFFAITDYIARDSPAAAHRIEDAILSTCGFLASHPKAGRRRDDLTDKPVRFWTLQPFPNYLIVYRPSADGITVIRIIHAARDLRREFK